MERFFKKRALNSDEGSSRANSSNPIIIDINNLSWDPADRPRITDYHPNQRDEIRRLYLQRGPCQPRGHVFPSKTIGGKARRFVVTWFNDYPWLEYSVKVDKAYCLWCYLFRDNVGYQGGSDTFVIDGFNSWSKKDRLDTHVGEVNSFHNKAYLKCENLKKQSRSISTAFHKQSETSKEQYRVRLTCTIDVCRFLVNCELAFRGHDESESSFNRGNFLEGLKLVGKRNKSISNVTLGKAPKNHQMIAPKIQKGIVQCFAAEILKEFFDEMGNDVFALLVDESSDVTRKEQMAVVVRYVDARGLVKERFIGLVHVTDTSSLTLKASIDKLFAKHRLSLKQLRGQGYDGASNMRGEFNGLKALILKENSSAYYVHCFAHQLQLVVVAVAKHHFGVGNFFDMLSTTLNVVCASCKRKDMIREGYKMRLEEAIENGEIETGKGLNQEQSLIRAGDTRWGSHHKTMMSLVYLFPEVIAVLEYVQKEADNTLSRRQAFGILNYFHTFDFVFYLHLMLHILGLTDVLSRALQKKDQDLLEAVKLIKGTKTSLQKFRENGFVPLLEKISSFCQQHNLDMLNMEDHYVNPRNRKTNITDRYYYNVDVFNTVLDMQIQEFDDRFNEVSTELLDNMSSLSPSASFRLFDASKIMKLSEMYPYDFDFMERIHLERELDIYYEVITQDELFANLKSISELARSMVETDKHHFFPYVYRLLKLVLVLPVATATVERCFSKMNIIKSDLRNRIGDDFLSDCLICGVEKEALAKVTDEEVIERFQGLKDRKEYL